ncbi:unnamed protein product [Diatraea saccharalis]|uniref:Gustatory receptor n=1 Tax=Diatraea saccharalis TaxID=40085 RepID=A0A9N9WES9_9NEOP|nr:unnamed protein product [Diatraea saccharalis]
MDNKVQPSVTPENKNAEDNVPRKPKVNETIHSMKAVFLLENFYGIFRCRVTEEGLIPTNKKLKFITLLITSTYALLFITMLRLLRAINGIGKIVDAIDEVPSIVIIAQYVSSTIRTSFLLSESNIRLFKSIADLDFKLHIDTNKGFYKSTCRVTVICMLILVIFHLLFAAADLLTEDDNIPLSKIVILPIYFEQNLELSVFCLMIWMLSKRLVVINNYIAVFIKEKETKLSIFLVKDKETKEKAKEFNLIGQPSPDNMKIRDLALTYDIIGETCALINNIYNFQIFMSLVATFCYIVITIWSSLFYYMHSLGRNQDYGSLATIIIWCTTAVVGVGMLSLSCERLLVKRNETKVLVNKIIMDYDLPKNMRVQAKAFMELIEAWHLRIFIYDMFSVDISLMLKFISVATTYLIVIIQITHFL